jgi:hypothetical protein
MLTGLSFFLLVHFLHGATADQRLESLSTINQTCTCTTTNSSNSNKQATTIQTLALYLLSEDYFYCTAALFLFCTAAQMNTLFSLSVIHCNTDVISLSVVRHADSCQRTSRQFVQPWYRFLSLLSVPILRVN